MDQPIAVIIPVCGQPALTSALLEDIEPELDLVEVLIVDNGGDYQPDGAERVVQTPRNLGWTLGCNLGLELAAELSSRAFVLLNNDTRLSPGFFAGMLTAWEETGAALLGPIYDDVWPTQHADFRGPARDYSPRREHRSVGFIDGTCMFIPRATYEMIGRLDEEHFGRFGWGAEFDYSIRVRASGGTIQVTELAYLNHVRQGTARVLYPDYEGLAGSEMNDGMQRKWGSDWHRLIQEPGVSPYPL